MFLSFCIPTYNRCKFLKKNLDLLARQIRECNVLNDVEINVSDNGSLDDTDVIVKNFITNNQDIKVGYHHSEQNLGPDKNYIAAMYMAHGEYTILLGDDDYLTDGALSLIISILKDHPSVDIFISNRIEISEEGTFLREHYFLDSNLDSMKFDFSDVKQAFDYFSKCQDVGGCFTFISSIIYKSSILSELGAYNGCLDGTFYSFWFYIWGKLNRGGKLFYIRKPYILNTQTYNANFGNGLARSLVEFEGFYKASELLFYNIPYKQDFIDIPKKSKLTSELVKEIILDKKTFKTRLLPILKLSRWSEQEISSLISLSEISFGFSLVWYHLVPSVMFKYFMEIKLIIKKILK